MLIILLRGASGKHDQTRNSRSHQHMQIRDHDKIVEFSARPHKRMVKARLTTTADIAVFRYLNACCRRVLDEPPDAHWRNVRPCARKTLQNDHPASRRSYGKDRPAVHHASKRPGAGAGSARGPGQPPVGGLTAPCSQSDADPAPHPGAEGRTRACDKSASCAYDAHSIGVCRARSRASNAPSRPNGCSDPVGLAAVPLATAEAAARAKRET